MPRLRVLAGPSLEELYPVCANSHTPVHISSELFEGQVAVFIKGFADHCGKVNESSYFEAEERKGITWSIQMQGRFLQSYSADDILFGNTFDRPLKLPWGFSAAVKFMQFRDPTLDQDLASKTKPWAFSPLIATMPYLRHQRVEREGQSPPFPPEHPTGEDTSALCTADGRSSAARPKESKNNEKRRTHFRNRVHRQGVIFGPDDLITVDFCHRHLYFSPKGIDLRIPGGISIDIMKYWDGQPVRFVCCERVRDGQGASGKPWGRVFWSTVRCIISLVY
ncbi:hypothetical protein BKA93DRAFT_888297 [Sparassis latifolia]